MGVLLWMSKSLFWAAILAHCVQYRRLFPWPSYDAWVDRHHNTIFNLHPFVVCACLLGAHMYQWSGDDSLLYVVGAGLVWSVWEGGKPVIVDKLNWMFINLHHTGPVIAFLYQGTEASASRAWHNTFFFTSVWGIHAFGWLQQVVLPPKPKQKAHHYAAMELVRHLYGLANVILFYRFLCAEGQPGLGWNHQTVACGCMLVGRFGAMNNFQGVPFIRHVEVPGITLVVTAYLIHRGHYTLTCVFLLALVACVVHLSGFFLTPLPEPVPLPSEPAAPQLVLVQAASPRRLVFEHAEALRTHNLTTLTLLSPPGKAVVPKVSVPDGPYAVGGGHWMVVPAGIGTPDNAMRVLLDKEGFITREHDGRVLDISMWLYTEENPVNFVNDRFSREKTRRAGGGRTFRCNTDGTVSPVHATHLVLGMAR